MIGGVAAGCSSDVMRFQDSILTGSSRQQQAAPVQQAYPGDYSGLDQTTTASIAPRRGGGILGRAGLTPRPQGNVGGVAVAAAPANGGYQSNPYPANPYPVQQQQQVAYAAPVRQAVTAGPALAPVASSPSLDTTVTGSTSSAPLQVPAAQPLPAAPATPAVAAQQQPAPAGLSSTGGGWSRAGGTQVGVKQGETVYNLSRRFGVPVDAILKANGMSNATALAAGQQVVIPTYVHSAQAPVSAPDANPNVADARSSTGTRYDLPADRVPVPAGAPTERLAVLPQQPRLKEGEAGAQVASADTSRTGTSGGYTVVAGDTLDAIARRNGITTAALKQANGLTGGMIRIGQKLVIPAAGATQVAAAPAARTDATTTASVAPASAEAQKPAAYTPPQQAEKVIQQASLDTSASAPDATGISRMRWPVRGRVISGFGSGGGAKNDGIDIAVPEGTPVRAAENGVVIYAGDGLKEFGNTVLVRHEDGVVTVYGHASAINVQRGQKVRRGDEIAKAGMSGSAETPKLHFEVRKESRPVDPASYLE